MRQISISYYSNETFSLQCRTATTDRCVQNGGPGGRGGAGCCWGGLLEGRSGGVVADYGEMGSVWGNQCGRVTKWREWLESDLWRRMFVQVVSSALGIRVGRAQEPSGAVAEMVEAWNEFGVKWLVDLCCGVASGASLQEWMNTPRCGLYRAIGLLEQVMRVVGRMLACRIWR